jgi:hypothetical protein
MSGDRIHGSKEGASSHAPFGFQEELELERLAVAEHEERARRLWNAREYGQALLELWRAADSRRHVEELERKEER